MVTISRFPTKKVWVTHTMVYNPTTTTIAYYGY